jgi:drug/metabolite transporter (DMT)-like permease
MTFGALWQKRSRQAPADVLPLQYAVSGAVPVAPVSGFRFTVNAGLIIPVLFLGLLISVVAQLLLYRLLSAGNIVNVTSLFYLVPAITALLDYLLLGNRLPAAAMVGMVAIVGGSCWCSAPGPRRLMASRALRRPVHFPVIFFTHAPGSLF